MLSSDTLDILEALRQCCEDAGLVRAPVFVIREYIPQQMPEAVISDMLRDAEHLGLVRSCGRYWSLTAKGEEVAA